VDKDNLQLVTATVTYSVQGQDFDVE